MSAPDATVEMSGTEAAPSTEEKAAGSGTGQDGTAAEGANPSQTAGQVEAGAETAGEGTKPPQTEGNAEAGTDQADTTGEAAKPSETDESAQAGTDQAEAAPPTVRKLSPIASEIIEDEFDSEIRAKLHAPSGDTFKSVVEYTITRGKRVIQNEKTVLLPKGINFKNGKAGLLKAYDLEENKWDLVHDDRDAKRRTAELVGEGEDRKRVFTATQLYRAYTVDMETYPYFIDKRLKQFEVEVNQVENEEIWKECLSDLPWSRLDLYEKTMYLSALKLAGGVESLLQEPEAKADEAEPSGEDAEQEDGQDKFTLPPMETMPETTLEGADLYEMQLEGAHALWEFSVERVHHSLFTPGILHAMLKTLKPGIAHLVHMVSAALWMLVISAKPRRFLALNGGIEALMTCLKYGMGPPDGVPGVDEAAELQEFGAKQWLKKRGPTINPDTMLTHKESAVLILTGKANRFSRVTKSTKNLMARAKTMKKIDTAGFDDTAAEDEPSTVAKGMDKLLKKKKKKGKKGKKKKGTKKAKSKSKKAEPEPEPEPEPEEPEETPEEAAAREAAEEEAERLAAEEKAKMVKSLADFERENVHALTPNRKNLITNNCIGAISIILLDEEARVSLFELEPTLESFFALANVDHGEEDEPGSEMENHVQRLAIEVLLNIATRHRDKARLVQFVGAKGIIPKLCDLMESKQTYVKLCSSIIFATLLNLPGAAAAVSAAGYDQELFKRLVDALHKSVPELQEEAREYKAPTKVLVNLVNTNATAIWKAAPPCLPPHGKGVSEEYLNKLVEAADLALLSPQAKPCNHAMAGVFAHFSRDPETAAKLIKIEKLIPMLQKQLMTEQTQVRICAIAAIGNLGSHGAVDVDPTLPPPTAFLVGLYREFLAYHLFERMQVAVLMGVPDFPDDEELQYRLTMVGACATMWLTSTANPTREDPGIMDRLLQMVEKASKVKTLVYLMPALWMMARSDYNREYLVAALPLDERDEDWTYDYVSSEEQQARRNEVQEEFTEAWQGPMGAKTGLGFGQADDEGIAENPEEEDGDGNAEAIEPSFPKVSSRKLSSMRREVSPLVAQRSGINFRIEMDDDKDEDIPGELPQAVAEKSRFHKAMSLKSQKSYRVMEMARTKATNDDPFIKVMSNSWCLNLMAKVGTEHIQELDGEEDEDSWVSQMYTYWAGALWLIMYTDNDKPYEMENVFELRNSSWWTVPPANPDRVIMGARPNVSLGVVDALLEVCMVSGMGTHTVRRVVTGSLWNLATLDFGLEMRMVEKGLPAKLKETAMDGTVHYKLRQWSAAFVHRLAQRDNGGGWELISDVAVNLMQSDEPLLVQQGLRMMVNACNQKEQKLRLGDNTISMLLKVVQMSPLFFMPYSMPLEDGEEQKLNSKRPSALIREGFKDMTMEDMERWISEKATDPNFILDAPEFDPHFGEEGEDCRERIDSPFSRVSGIFALFALMNLSSHPTNQGWISKKGYRTLLNVNYFFKCMYEELRDLESAEEMYCGFLSQLMCYYSSATLHNCRKCKKTGTLRYRMELERNCMIEQQLEDFNPMVGVKVAPNPFNSPEKGLELLRALPNKKNLSSAWSRLRATRAESCALMLVSSVEFGSEAGDLEESGSVASGPLEAEMSKASSVRSGGSRLSNRSNLKPDTGKKALRPSLSTSQGLRPSTAPEPTAVTMTPIRNKKPSTPVIKGRRWGSSHSRFLLPTPVEEQKRTRKSVEDDKKREEFVSWMQNSFNSPADNKHVPEFMKPIPSVKPKDVGMLTSVLEANMEAHSHLKSMNQRMASNSPIWKELPNEPNFGLRGGQARWEPEIKEYAQLPEKESPGMSLIARNLLMSKRPHSAFRRLTDAAEWVAKAAAEDRLAVNGGHVPRPYPNTLDALEEFCKPPESSDEEDQHEEQEGGGSPGLHRIMSRTREDPFAKKDLPDPEPIDEEDEGGSVPSPVKEPPSKPGRGKDEGSKSAKQAAIAPSTPPALERTASPRTSPATRPKSRGHLSASVPLFKSIPRPATCPAPNPARTTALRGSTGTFQRDRYYSRDTFPSNDGSSVSSLGSSYRPSRPITREDVTSQVCTTDFCLMQKLPTTPGMWNEEESEYVINGAPVTVMLPALTPRNEEEIAEELPEQLPLSVVMNPGGNKNTIRFNRSLDNMVNGQQGGDVVVFEHVPGSKLFPTLFPYYLLPNGKKVFFYYKGADLVKEITFPLEITPRRPDTLASLYRDRLPNDPPLVEEAEPGAMESPAKIRPVPPLGMPPNQHSLDVSEPPEFYADLQMRPRKLKLIPIEVSKEEFVEIVEDAPQGPPWKIEESIWAGRPKEMDSRNYWDGDKAYEKGCAVDWSRLEAKEKFITFLDRESKKFKSKLSTEEVTAAVGAVIRKEYEFISRMYRYYSSLGGSRSTGIPLNDWTELLTSADIPSNDSAHCKMSDCDTVFITANYMATKEKDIDENSLGRFQLIEAFCRISTAKYACSPEEALKKLFANNLHPNLPLEAAYDPNLFRTERFYNEEVDDLFKGKHKILEALHSRYRLPPRGGGLRSKNLIIGDWLQMCTDLHIYSGHFTERKARMCFAYAKPVIGDEFGNINRFMEMTFFDFIEALGHMADMVDFPTEEDLSLNGFDGIFEYNQLVRNDPNLALEIRESAHFANAKNRPLSDKMGMLLEYICKKLDYSDHDGYEYSDASFLKKLKEIDKALGP